MGWNPRVAQTAGAGVAAFLWGSQWGRSGEAAPPAAWTERLARAGSGKNLHMNTAVIVLVSVVTALTVVFVLGLFVWAARKDGEYDRSVQKRLGIRRRTRL